MKNYLIIIYIVSILINCTKSESACKKEARNKLIEECRNVIVEEYTKSTSKEVSQILSNRRAQDFCLISFIFFREQDEYCDQPFIYYQGL
ncbi:MAG: hypothetical protein O9346_16660 [Leptospiraceae bacterium]|jgi:hypothetical protein|nr:hypothetical protein [Leptospiraceae bacterium]MCZ8348045.1 hypothetical protein [Leptospiraceae bacterium]